MPHADHYAWRYAGSARALRAVCSIIMLLSFCYGCRTLYAQPEPASLEALTAQADRLLGQGETDEAARRYRQAVRLDEDLLAAHLGLARVAVEEARWKAAASRLDHVLKRDPEHMAAHYWQAIVYREQARITPFVDPNYRLRGSDDEWTRAIDHFEQVLAQDSTYRDVLYQYALLWHQARRFPRALELAHAQIRLRPDLLHAQQGLFRIYRSFVHHEKPRRVQAHLRKHPSEHGMYVQGELLRQEGELEEAEQMFKALLEASSDLPRQPVLLSLARIRYTQGEAERAQAFVEQAIEGITDKLGAELIFDDVKYIVSEEELEDYRRLTTAEAYRAFFRTFWTKRDPLPARTVNVRMAEHYRRLLRAERDYANYVLRTWHFNPDRTGELEFPAGYGLNEAFDDRGLVYIRHGNPTDRVIAVAPTRFGDGPPPSNESWRYENPRIDFHFDGENNWRLMPTLHSNRAIIDSRETWGHLYADLAHWRREMDKEEARGRTNDFLQIVVKGNIDREMIEQSRKHVALGLNTDRHTWPDSIEGFDFPYLASTFRAPDGQTRLELHYALPLGRFSNERGQTELLSIELGCALHDLAWQEVERSTNTQQVQPETDPTAAVTGSCHFTAAPDSYHVALHARPLGTRLVGGYKFDLGLPDYAQPELAMSDLLPAAYIGEAAAPSRFNRGALYVPPNPPGQYVVQKPLYFYFEVYNLTLDEDERTHYSLAYTLLPEKRKVLGLFGGAGSASLTLSMEREGTEVSPVEYAEIDISRVEPGPYTLTVTVTDEHTGAAVQRARQIELTK